MNNVRPISKLNIIKSDILEWSYTEDDDGDDERGRPIIRKVYTGMNESEMRAILDKIQDLIWEISNEEE